jgi:Protein of unknown function (DUF2281)
MNPQLPEDIAQLPPEAQREVADFVAFLSDRYHVGQQTVPPITHGDKTIDPNELFGLWQAAPRNLEALRRSAWQRS